MVSKGSYPGRTTSAPLAQPTRGLPALRTGPSPAGSSGGTAASPMQHHSGLPRAPPAPAGAGGVAMPSSPSQRQQPPPPAPAAAAVAQQPEAEDENSQNSNFDVPADVPYPEDCVYEVEDMIQLRKSTGPVPPAVMDFARSLWREMPENMDDPENNSLRNKLFKDQNAAMISKLMTDRKIQNEVLGILGKVTEVNLEKMKTELTNLPIRQSTAEEINEVIKVFFIKSTKPEDSCFTNLYVQLIAHLIGTIGEKEPAGRMIRREILYQCQDMFMTSGAQQAEMEARAATMTGEEADFERMQFSAKQKANIHFLGLMFTNHLVMQKVVHAVLDSLLYGNGLRRHVPRDFSLTNFMELLQVCGPQLDEEFYRDPLPRYAETLSDLSRTYPIRRIQFLLWNFIEMMNNNWVPVHGPGSRRNTETQSTAGSPVHRRGGSVATSGRGNDAASPNANPVQLVPLPLPMPDAAPKIPDYEEFSKVMDEFLVTSSVDETVSLLSTIPRDVTIAYCTKWLGRYINTYKYTAERTRMGELFDLLVKKNVITVEQAQEALLQHVQKSADEDLFSDIPKYFVHWASLIKHGHTVFPFSLHTKVLNMLVDSHVSIETITNMVRDVDADMRPELVKDLKPQERFRVLQALLRYSPPMFAHPTDEDWTDKLLEEVAKVDQEVAYFNLLCVSYEGGKLQSTSVLTDMQKQSPALCASAFFTFVRYDVNRLCLQFKEVLRKIFTARAADGLLVEVYLQWKTLDCTHRFFFDFVRKVLDVVNNRLDVLNKVCAQLRTTYREEPLAALLDEFIRERKA